MIKIPMLHGMFDADGNIFGQIDKKRRKNGSLYVNVTWMWEFTQTKANSGNVEAVARLLGRSAKDKARLTGRNAGKTETVVKGSLQSESGKILRTMYTENPPRTFKRIQQFVASEYCLTTFDAASTRDPANIIRELLICQHISTQKKQDVEGIIQEMNNSPDILLRARELARQDILKIDGKIARIWENVPNQLFTTDNILGAYVADGSFFTTYVVSSTGRLSFRPTFSIANEDKQPLEALQKSLGTGHIHKGGVKGFQFEISGVERFNQILRPIFEGAALPSAYKQRQWDVTARVVDMLTARLHTKFEGFCEIIDLTYNLSLTNKRKNPIDYYKNPKFVPKR